jgi:hypothetical protein
MKRSTAKKTRVQQPTAKWRPPVLHTITDPETLDDVYCLVADGICLEPLIPHGAGVVFKKSEKLSVGDIAVIWFRPDLDLPGGHRCWVKRLTMMFPSFVQFPFRDAPGSEISPVFSVDQFNPPKRFTIACDRVLAVHKVIGHVPIGKVGENIDMDKMVPIVSKEKPLIKSRERTDLTAKEILERCKDQIPVNELVSNTIAAHRIAFARLKTQARNPIIQRIAFYSLHAIVMAAERSGDDGRIRLDYLSELPEAAWEARNDFSAKNYREESLKMLVGRISLS